MKSKSESQKGERVIRGASTSGLASEEPPGRPGNGWRGLSGLDSGSDASREEAKRLSDFCTLTPFPFSKLSATALSMLYG